MSVDGAGTTPIPSRESYSFFFFLLFFFGLVSVFLEGRKIGSRSLLLPLPTVFVKCCRPTYPSSPHVCLRGVLPDGGKHGARNKCLCSSAWAISSLSIGMNYFSGRCSFFFSSFHHLLYKTGGLYSQRVMLSWPGLSIWAGVEIEMNASPPLFSSPSSWVPLETSPGLAMHHKPYYSELLFLIFLRCHFCAKQ